MVCPLPSFLGLMQSGFCTGNFFPARPLTISAAEIPQLGIVTTDAIQDLLTLFGAPLRQKLGFIVFFRTFNFVP